MAIFSKEEINMNTLETIRSLIDSGYSIFESTTDYKTKMISHLRKIDSEGNTFHITICEEFSNSTSSYSAIVKMNGVLQFTTSKLYYKAYDNVYSDSKKEADDERIKYSVKCYRDTHSSVKFPEIY